MKPKSVPAAQQTKKASTKDAALAMGRKLAQEVIDGVDQEHLSTTIYEFRNTINAHLKQQFAAHEKALKCADTASASLNSQLGVEESE